MKRLSTGPRLCAMTLPTTARLHVLMNGCCSFFCLRTFCFILKGRVGVRVSEGLLRTKLSPSDLVFAHDGATDNSRALPRVGLPMYVRCSFLGPHSRVVLPSAGAGLPLIDVWHVTSH